MGFCVVFVCILMVSFLTATTAQDDQSSVSSSSSTSGHGNLMAEMMKQQISLNAKVQNLETSMATNKKELHTTKKKLAATKKDLATTKTDLAATKTKLAATETDLASTKTALKAAETKLDTGLSSLKPGSSFIRWGRKSCPNNTSLVYVGVAGGKKYNQKGSGTNPLCLTRTPEFDNTTKPPMAYGLVYGGEYQYISGHHDHDVPCSVCLAPQSTTVMVPATKTCPPGWTPQYSGHLATQYGNHYATEYVCLDGSPEDDSSSTSNDNGHLFYYTVTVCGSLPCPPYENDKVVTCVVCSK